MKIAICIPCHGDTKADFTFSLDRMIAYSMRENRDLEIETLIARSSILVQSRTRLLEWSLEWGADKILWLDSDHTFPPESLSRLLEHDMPVVGANYRRRHRQVYPSAVRKRPDGQWEMIATTERKASDRLLEAVDRLGFGFLLMSTKDVIDALGGLRYPIFETNSLPDGGFIGEDALFCDRLTSAGMKIYVDHFLSFSVGHIGEENWKFLD